MNPIQKLKTEHQIILRGIGAMEEKTRLLASGENVSGDFFELAIDFIRNYADKYHHAKEENILFVRMEKAGFPRNSGPVAVMLYEHDEGRKYIAELEKANKLYSNGNQAARSDIIANSAAYTTLLRSHIQKEDNILYPMAINMLGESMISQMQVEFDEVEKRMAGIEAKYIGILDNM